MERVEFSNGLTVEKKPKYYNQPWNLIAWHDVVEGVKSYRLWHYLALTEIRRRYRRTIIGPFWTTLSIGIFIACMSFFLTAIWHNKNIKEFLPYFSAGYITWIMLSTLLNEGASTFILQEGTLKQFSRPYTLFACLTTWRNFIVFAHHMVIFALVLIFCRYPLNINLLWIIPGLLINFAAGVCICIFFGMICARYRDIQQIIVSMLQLVMFVTPIMWEPQQLGRKGLLMAQINPLYHYISLIRQPLLGFTPSIENFAFTIICTLIIGWFTFKLFSRKYPIIIYWL